MTHGYARFAGWVRTIHIYLTMSAFLLMMFFAVTGFILNHEDWLESQSVRRDTTATLAMPMLTEPDKLAIVEKLRSDFGATGAVSTFDVDPGTLHIEMKGPGRHTEADVDRKTGKMTLSVERKGLLMRLDDMHRGKDTGIQWRWMLDVSAGLLFLGSLSGILIWWALPRRRKWGIAALVGGTVIVAAVYWLVP